MRESRGGTGSPEPPGKQQVLKKKQLGLITLEKVGSPAIFDHPALTLENL